MASLNSFNASIVHFSQVQIPNKPPDVTVGTGNGNYNIDKASVPNYTQYVFTPLHI